MSPDGNDTSGSLHWFVVGVGRESGTESLSICPMERVMVIWQFADLQQRFVIKLLPSSSDLHHKFTMNCMSETPGSSSLQ